MSVSNEFISQKEYLKKYLSNDDVKKKKKKKVSGGAIKRSKIIDDDIDLKSMRPLDDDEVELYQMDEDAPLIAGIIDERPAEVKAQEYYNSKRWKVFAGDDGVNVVDALDKKQSVSDKLALMSESNDAKDSKIKESCSNKKDIFKRNNETKQLLSSNEKLPKDCRSKSSDSDISIDRNPKSSRNSSQNSNRYKRNNQNNSDEKATSNKTLQSCNDDSDLSPPRNEKKNSSKSKQDSDPSPPSKDKARKYNRSDSDPSPPRRDSRKSPKIREEKRSRQQSDSDNSPPRRESRRKSPISREQKTSRKNGSDNSLSKRESRRKSPNNREQKRVRKSDSDNSPPRRDSRRKSSVSREHKRSRKSDSDNSPPRRDSKRKSPICRQEKRSRNSESDKSPPRRGSRKKSSSREQKRSRQKSESDNSPPRRNFCKKTNYKSESDSDTSPPRIVNKEKRITTKYDTSSISKISRRKSSSDSDSSSSKKDRRFPVIPSSAKRNTSYVSPRLSRRDLLHEKNVKRRFSDSDDSPPRRRSNSFRLNESDSDMSVLKKKPLKKDKPVKKALYRPNDSSSSDENLRSKSKKMKTTLDGKQAGLQDAKQLRKELSDLRMKEDALFSKMDASVSGVGAAPIKRDRKTGEVRDLEKEKEAQKEKDAKAAVVNEKYYKWGKGLKQVEDATERAAEAMKEMNKPLARYINDTDLDNFLKAQEREGDPMLDYIKKKQSEATPLVGEKPIYKGSYNPNRFGIRPGHRWDGVVRSNGYEKEWFTHQNARKARDEDAYKWSTSDM